MTGSGRLYAVAAVNNRGSIAPKTENSRAGIRNMPNIVEKLAWKTSSWAYLPI
jgi:hypothetical protein